ncbi:bifunctional glycogen debranching protein GlgX/4-alpha-glucanotransferase [Dehalobacter sp. DCM]|uniref:bifunctional glycogen debranching protein GlgX/4-alpha-glucanotransferase n=1 Tax=Dehalobacter sp. DCM TaxID=2907827 RepID=UPI0030817AB9|nr:bifunctional glycogen debranching protein GlgX/4-alpha-glucanotransferase [Dehalobacter sp. DCM]
MHAIKACHNTYQTYYRQPFGALKCGQKVLLRLEIINVLPIEECILWVSENENYKYIAMRSIQEIKVENNMRRLLFEVEYCVSQVPGLVWYYFIIRADRVYYYGNNSESLGGEGELSINIPPAYQITIYNPSPVPEWFKQGLIYQIFVDRFFNGNENKQICSPKSESLLHGNWSDTPLYIKDKNGRVIRWTFFGGNIRGVIAKLPYLEELGVSVIYLNPIFESASNHKYDVGNYLKIDPMYGESNTFDQLVSEAVKFGISVILDGVFSHTGSDSIYFNKYGNYPGVGAFQSAESPYYKWYRFKDNIGNYECWWGIDDLPNVNEMDTSYIDYIILGENSVIKTWMNKGVKGWRLDVADELPDEFIKLLKKTVKKFYPDSVLIGEVWEDASRKISYGKLREYFWGEELDSVTNYTLRSILLEFLLGKACSGYTYRRVMSLYENYPPENFSAAMNMTGSHDTVRILTLLGEAEPQENLSEQARAMYRLTPESREKAIGRLKLFVLLQMTFPGVPCIYYGDETGLEGYDDPYNRRTFPWGSEDQELISWYKRIIRLRREYEVINRGIFTPFCPNPDVFGFRIASEDEELIVYINRHQVRSVEIDYDFSNRPSRDEPENLITLDLLHGTEIKSKKDILNPWEGKVIYRYIKKTPLLKLDRSCGLLMHITSLPSPFGIGDIGEEAKKFIDFLNESGQRLWQILPLSPPGNGDSPYQSISVFAGNTLLICIEDLLKHELLTEVEVNNILERAKASVKYKKANTEKGNKVDYQFARDVKEHLLRRAFTRFKSRIRKLINNNAGDSGFLSWNTYQAFNENNNDWLEDYCLYCVLKDRKGQSPWYEWESEIAFRNKEVLASLKKEYHDELEYHRFLQYTFYFQWEELRRYAEDKGIKIIGDLPIYVNADSCDTWVNPKYFSLDSRGMTSAMAGVPPDYFSKTGQLWGNPLYQWPEMEKDNYSWWKQRIKTTLKMFHYVRLDHFRGFEAYWKVPHGESTAVNGRWLKGPGKKFFHSLEQEFGALPFIAEDLGLITPEVRNLKTILGFPGMTVYQFSPNELNTSTSDKSDMNWDNSILYSGTHDTDTLLGWYSKGPGKALTTDENKEQCCQIIEELYRSKAPWVIIPLQDVLMLDSNARMNVPGTAEGNWRWKIGDWKSTKSMTKWLKALSQQSRT